MNEPEDDVISKEQWSPSSFPREEYEEELARYEPPDAKHRAMERVRSGEPCDINDCPNAATVVGEIIGKHAGWKAICPTHEAKFLDW